MGADRDDENGPLGRLPKSVAKLALFAVALTLSFQATTFFVAPIVPDNQPKARKLAANDPIPGTCNAMAKTELGGTVLKQVRHHAYQSSLIYTSSDGICPLQSWL